MSPQSTQAVAGADWYDSGIGFAIPLTHIYSVLDKLKAGDRKTAAPMEVGYNSALPALLALEAMKDNTIRGWDPAAKASRTL